MKPLQNSTMHYNSWSVCQGLQMTFAGLYPLSYALDYAKQIRLCVRDMGIITVDA